MFGNNELQRLYLFDSHSRDPHGRNIQDGTSVLLRFKNMLDLSKYIISTYFAPPLTSLQYEIHFVSILIDNLSFSQKTLKAFQRKGSGKKSVRGYFPSINSENSIGDLVYSSQCVVFVIKDVLNSLASVQECSVHVTLYIRLFILLLTHL